MTTILAAAALAAGLAMAMEMVSVAVALGCKTSFVAGAVSAAEKL